jgi:prevent-host-death family protein
MVIIERAMKKMSVHEAKAKFSAVLREVAQGETIIVTKHDEPVAEISPVKKPRVPVLGAFAEPGAEHFEVSWTEEELYELFGEEYGFEPPK